MLSYRCLGSFLGRPLDRYEFEIADIGDAAIRDVLGKIEISRGRRPARLQAGLDGFGDRIGGAELGELRRVLGILGPRQHAGLRPQLDNLGHHALGRFRAAERARKAARLFQAGVMQDLVAAGIAEIDRPVSSRDAR